MATKLGSGLALLSCWACQGYIATPGDAQSTDVEAAVEPGPSPIRRLNRFEYNNTVLSLLGDEAKPANAFPSWGRRASRRLTDPWRSATS